MPTHKNSAGQLEDGDWSDPSGSFAAITAHATNPVDPIPRAIYVGTGGTIVCRGENDAADVTFANVANGTILPISPKFIRATSTASGIIGLY